MGAADFVLFGVIWVLLMRTLNAEEENLSTTNSEMTQEKISEIKDIDWLKIAPGKNFPDNAFRGGQTRMGDLVYVGICYTSSKSTVPCTAFNNAAFFVDGEITRQAYNYKVLLQPSEKEIFYNWVHASSNNIPSDAISCCTTESGEPVYIARVVLSHTDLFIGQYVPSENVAKVAYLNRIHTFKDFQVLVKVNESSGQDRWVSGDLNPYCNAVIASMENPSDPAIVYVGRAFYIGNFYACRAIKDSCYISMKYRGEITHIFEVLVHSPGVKYKWQYVNESAEAPSDAVVVDRYLWSNIYVGKDDWDSNNTVMGSVIDSVLYQHVGWEDREKSSYYILIKKRV